MGKDSSTPATPDYVGAANATAAGDLESARANAAANRVNQVTPYGNLTYSQDTGGYFDSNAYNKALAAYNAPIAPGSSQTSSSLAKSLHYTGAGENGSTGTAGVAPKMSDYYVGGNPDGGWTATTSLTPAQQAILDQTNSLNLGLMGTANTGLNYANDVLSHPGVDTSSLPQVGIDPGQSYQDAMMSRLSPQITRENQQSDAQLANQGLTQGSEAYNNAKTLLGQQHNDLLNNATVQGFNTGLSANQNAFQQQSYNQMLPINMINALRTGSQVQNPTFTNVPQQQSTKGADLLGATQAGYNANLNSANAQNQSNANTTSGLASIASIVAMLI